MNKNGRNVKIADFLAVRPDALIYLGGICIGRLVDIGGKLYLEVKDQNAGRCRDMGRDYVYIDINILHKELIRKAANAGPVDERR